MTSDASNIKGSAYALTVFAAILPGHEDELRRTIESVPLGAASPMAKLPVHTSRLQIFDTLVYQGAPQKPDTLKSKYLVFTAVFDGQLDEFLDLLGDRIGRDVDAWWSHCVAYPGASDRSAFKRWIRHNQIRTSLFEVASPGETVDSARAAIALRERVLDFAIAVQGLGPREVQERFRRTFTEIA